MKGLPNEIKSFWKQMNRNVFVIGSCLLSFKCVASTYCLANEMMDTCRMGVISAFKSRNCNYYFKFLSSTEFCCSI